MTNKPGDGWIAEIYEKPKYAPDFFIQHIEDDIPYFPHDLGKNWLVEEQSLFYLGDGDSIQELKDLGFIIEE